MRRRRIVWITLSTVLACRSSAVPSSSSPPAANAAPPVPPSAPPPTVMTAPSTTADATPPGRVHILAEAPSNQGAIAVDESWVYWLDGQHGLARVPKRGGGAATSLQAVAAGADAFGLVALGGRDIYYAIDAGAARGLWRMRRDVADAGAAEAIDKRDVACLVADAQGAYWLRLARNGVWAAGGSVMRAVPADRSPKVLAGIKTPSFGCLAADVASVYFVAFDENGTDHEIRAAPKGGGPTRIVTTFDGAPLHLQVSGENLYWVEGEQVRWAAKGERGPSHAVGSVPRSCGTVRGMAVDAMNVYFTCEGIVGGGGSVWRIAKTGGAADVIAEGQDHPWSVVAEDGALYWSNLGSPSRSGSIVGFALSQRGSPSTIAPASDAETEGGSEIDRTGRVLGPASPPRPQ